EADAVLALVRARDDRDRNTAGVLHELDRLAAEPTRATPDEDDARLFGGAVFVFNAKALCKSGTVLILHLAHSHILRR
ncbi:MAG TPA: hypothetical protein VMV58_04565, partial [Desulfosporosinus sp.]|nr:hypothetical protein [Desulfosporosinus sp.]